MVVYSIEESFEMFLFLNLEVRNILCLFMGLFLGF